LAELRVLAASSVDAIVTLPPYNIGVAYRSYNGRRPKEAYLAWLGEVGLEIKRVLEPEGSLFLNVGGTNTDPWLPMDVAATSISIREDSHGHFKPIRSQRFLNPNHETLRRDW
jgi:site-specific DNA-methyltransferase (adenine-specific)